MAEKEELKQAAFSLGMTELMTVKEQDKCFKLLHLI